MKSRVLSSLVLLVGFALLLGSCLNDDTITAYQRLQKDIAKIDAYLAANPPDASDTLIKDASGIRMIITQQPEVEEGEFPIPPTPENLIQVKYAGWLFSEIDSGDPFETDDSFVFTLTSADPGDDVIQGWKSALYMMTQGMKARVFIPSGLGYGPGGNRSIPGNAVLVFDLELLTVNTENEETQLAIDKVKISQHLEGEENVVEHPSGMSYVLESTGTGPVPKLYDHVTVKYTGKVLNGETFATDQIQGPSNTFSSRVVNYIHGLIIGLQLMHEGDKATFYIPSALGYGPSNSTGIPPNSVLVFEVELQKVTPNGEL